MLKRSPHWSHWSTSTLYWLSVSDWASPSCLCCSRTTCLTVSKTVWQSYSANIWHYYYYLSPWSYHTLSSVCQSCTNLNQSLSDLSADQSLSTAGCAWPVQVQSSNFSPDTCLSQSPINSPEWVMLHDFSLVFLVSSLQAEWLWSIANSEVTNKVGTTSRSNY